MVATGQWDNAVGMPVARPLAAADLFRDQTARNGMTTLEAAARRGGMRFKELVASCSDGTDHAVQESEGICVRAHVLGGAAGGQKSQADFCCIHGKALEENGGMKAAFPDNYLVDALRLLWEVVCGPEGRPRFYRGIWEQEVSIVSIVSIVSTVSMHKELKAGFSWVWRWGKKSPSNCPPAIRYKI